MDIVNSSSPVGKAAVEIIQWLGRERIDKSDYEYCLTHSRALTVPNEYGLEIRSSILNVEKQMTRPGGLQLLLPSSIGRWMSFSADHCYMVTTVAAVTKFHDFDYAINLLCDTILVDGNPNSDQMEYTYSVHQTRLKGILSKVVNSIALNVVNPGHDLGQLPQELSGYCVHLTDHQTFASIVLRIQRSKEDMLLYCARFQGDLFVWLSAHFEGIIEVSIASKTVFEKATKFGKRKMMILVRETCTPEIDCHDVRTVHSIELSERYEDRWEQIFQGKDDSGRGRASTPAQRQPLYTMKHSPFSGLNEILNRKELHEIKLAAQSIIKWLLGVTLKPHLEADLFGFAIA